MLCPFVPHTLPQGWGPLPEMRALQSVPGEFVRPVESLAVLTPPEAEELCEGPSSVSHWHFRATHSQEEGRKNAWRPTGAVGPLPPPYPPMCHTFPTCSFLVSQKPQESHTYPSAGQSLDTFSFSYGIRNRDEVSFIKKLRQK